MSAIQATGSTQPEFHASVRAQALVRLKLGFPVLFLMLLSIAIDGTSRPGIGYGLIAAFALVYLAYNLGALLLARDPELLSTTRLVIITAVLDPVMLSGWLLLMGQASILFICFYLFTILGYGFRTGIASMRICQAASLIGFIAVIMLSPVWREQNLVALSNLIFLVVVPMYATSLIRNLHLAREQAQRESQAKSQLLANVSHELRTPLAGIVSSAQLIEAEVVETQSAEHAGSILKLAAELDQEIDHLLDAAKYQSGLVIVDSGAVDLKDVVAKVQRTLAPVAGLKKIGFSVRVDERLNRHVVADARLLGSVLMNLAGNAVKFTERGRADVSIDLVDEQPDRYLLRFSVKDTGIGIPRELQERVFEPFYQVSSGTSRRFGGTGLGTSIAKDLVALMGGELRLDSEPGKGSEFWFELPMVKAQPVAEPAPEQTPESTEIVRGKRILVVDDNAANLRLLTEMLKKDQHLVVAADSGVKALEYLAGRQFDAVLLDFNMSDVDGAEVFQLYRFGCTEIAPTFFITADTTRITKQRLLALGAAGVLHKPITFNCLRTALASALGAAPAAADAGTAFSEPTPLRAVPVEYIDSRAIDSLREVSDDPAFLAEMISVGITDMERLGRELIVAIESGDIEAVRHHAHALKGVSLNLGAKRLATLAGRLMTIDSEELKKSAGQWRLGIRDDTQASIEGLRAVQVAAA